MRHYAYIHITYTLGLVVNVELESIRFEMLHWSWMLGINQAAFVHFLFRHYPSARFE